jgi:hypothetical protein
VRTVLVATAAALALAPAAAGATQPKLPAGFHFVFPHRAVLVPIQQRRERQQSCAAESRKKSKSRVAKPRPVACEQPPRVNLNGASGSIIAALHP